MPLIYVHMTSTDSGEVIVLPGFMVEAHFRSVASDLLNDDSIKDLAERAYTVPRSVLLSEDLSLIREECNPARIIAKFEPKKLSKKRKSHDSFESLPFCCALPKASLLHLPEDAAMSLQNCRVSSMAIRCSLDNTLRLVAGSYIPTRRFRIARRRRRASAGEEGDGPLRTRSSARTCSEKETSASIP